VVGVIDGFTEGASEGCEVGDALQNKRKK